MNYRERLTLSGNRCLRGRLFCTEAPRGVFGWLRRLSSWMRVCESRMRLVPFENSSTLNWSVSPTLPIVPSSLTNCLAGKMERASAEITRVNEILNKHLTQ